MKERGKKILESIKNIIIHISNFEINIISEHNSSNIIMKFKKIIINLFIIGRGMDSNWDESGLV